MFVFSNINLFCFLFYKNFELHRIIIVKVSSTNLFLNFTTIDNHRITKCFETIMSVVSFV